MDIALGLVLVAVGVFAVARSRRLSDRLRRDPWPFGNVYALRQLNGISASRFTVVVFGCGVILIGALTLFG